MQLSDGMIPTSQFQAPPPKKPLLGGSDNFEYCVIYEGVGDDEVVRLRVHYSVRINLISLRCISLISAELYYSNRKNLQSPDSTI